MESKNSFFFYSCDSDSGPQEVPGKSSSSPSSSSSSNARFRRSISEGAGARAAYATVGTSSPKRRAGRKKFKETRHPVYKGVRRRNGDKWVCEVREPNKQSRIWLGTFPTAEMAARAHDVAAIALRGQSACLNFADSAWLLPVPSSLDSKEIRRVAVEAAEAFRPQAAASGNEEAKGAMGSSQEVTFYMDEEVDLGMPALLASMAEGMLMSPPRMGSEGGPSWDDVESNDDVSLWSYSI